MPVSDACGRFVIAERRKVEVVEREALIDLALRGPLLDSEEAVSAEEWELVRGETWERWERDLVATWERWDWPPRGRFRSWPPDGAARYDGIEGRVLSVIYPHAGQVGKVEALASKAVAELDAATPEVKAAIPKVYKDLVEHVAEHPAELICANPNPYPPIRGAAN
jgi:hypothetical protein